MIFAESRLCDIGLWAGAWRSGSDAYYLWANVSEGDFLTKWSQLQGQNLRLVDLEVTALAGAAGGSTGGATDSSAVASAAEGARVGNVKNNDPSLTKADRRHRVISLTN